MDTYRQVELIKDQSNTQIRDIVWVPRKFAVQGKILKKKVDGKWDDGWRVIAVYSARLAAAVIEKRSRDHRSMSTFKE